MTGDRLETADVEWLPWKADGDDATLIAYVGLYRVFLGHDGECWCWRLDLLGECENPSTQVDGANGLVTGSLGTAQARATQMARMLSSLVEARAVKVASMLSSLVDDDAGQASYAGEQLRNSVTSVLRDLESLGSAPGLVSVLRAALAKFAECKPEGSSPTWERRAREYRTCAGDFQAERDEVRDKLDALIAAVQVVLEGVLAFQYGGSAPREQHLRSWSVHLRTALDAANVDAPAECECGPGARFDEGSQALASTRDPRPAASAGVRSAMARPRSSPTAACQSKATRGAGSLRVENTGSTWAAGAPR